MMTMFRLCLLLIVAIFVCSCREDVHQSIITNEPIADFQKELLDISFKTATSIPVNPHVKDRSKAQQSVIDTCIKLGQPVKAEAFLPEVDNWRRNLCYANLAFYCAQQGYADQAKRYLDMAEKLREEDQHWRTDRIKAQITKTHLLLGQTGQADKLRKDFANNETDEKAQVIAIVNDKDSFDEQVKTLDSLIASGNFNILKNATLAYAQLFNRFYDNKEHRSLAENKIKTHWEKLPVHIRIDLLLELAEFAMDHADSEKTLELLDEAQAFMDSYEWPIEQLIPMTAKLVELRFHAGDSEKSKTDIKAAYDLFNAQKNKIVDIRRAETLRSLAEAYQLTGDKQMSLSVYKQVVEEGIENINSRPRAEDLSVTCCSMALHAVEPDDQLWERIHHIYEGLGKPW